MKKISIATLFTASILSADIIYISNEKDNTLSVIDSYSNKVVKTIEVGQRPRGILLNKDKSLLYICASDDDTVQILDTKTNKIIGDLPSGDDPEQFYLHPNSEIEYAFVGRS